MVLVDKDLNEDEFYTVDCPICHGLGFTKEGLCPHCNGTGVVKKNNIQLEKIADQAKELVRK